MKKLTLTIIIALWGMLSFMVLAGEEVEVMSVAKFITIKAIALISFCACLFTAKRLDEKGLLYTRKEE